MPCERGAVGLGLELTEAWRERRMPGLFDAHLGDAAVSGRRSGVLRRVRHSASDIVVAADDEVGLVLNLDDSLAITRRLDGRPSSARSRFGAVTLMPPGRPTAFKLVGTARVLMLRLPWSEMCAWYAEDHDGDGHIELEPRLAFSDPILARLLCAAAASPAEGEEGPLRVSCTRFPWTAICPTGDRHDEVQHERNRKR